VRTLDKVETLKQELPSRTRTDRGQTGHGGKQARDAPSGRTTADLP